MRTTIPLAFIGLDSVTLTLWLTERYNKHSQRKICFAEMIIQFCFLGCATFFWSTFRETIRENYSNLSLKHSSAPVALI